MMHVVRGWCGVAPLGLLVACLVPTSNFQEPISTSSTPAGSTSGTTDDTVSGGPGSGPITTTTTDTTTTTTDTDTSATSEATTSGSSGGSTGGLTDNACLVKDSYPDLGAIEDTIAFFVEGSPQSTGADVFLTDSNIEPFDVVIVEMTEGEPPFNNVPQPGIYNVADLGAQACQGVCVSLHGDASFNAGGFITPTFRLAAISGTLTITQLEWDAATPTNGRVAGTASDLVFAEVDELTGNLVDGGCMVAIDGFSFDEMVTNIVTP